MKMKRRNKGISREREEYKIAEQKQKIFKAEEQQNKRQDDINR